MKNTIKLNRAKTGITQADLAERVKVSRQTINAIELGKYAPSTVLALKLSAIFQVSVNELFELEGSDWD
ncbi:MAG: helix-turn-helix transcriptional regulator [Eudoraea sp.]|nr:helix-turn-helix transcriptional regulator [Eudoraea sp.]MBT8210337.1 helix-turn-helix transcriptional regulator [Eudoraea sp.]MBT8222207.1 helix-turn-helix transcriptional regulator [Eudoraea sp.]NNK30750.1 helix-turn-helix transcriptional regulator [Flavobacteriaceae bacterium]